MEEDQKRLRLSRRGFRAHLATLTTSLNELSGRSKEHPLEEDDVIALTSLLEQLTRKKQILSDLDEKIVALVDEKDLEAEIVESEELQSSISRNITRAKRLLNNPKPPASTSDSPHRDGGERREERPIAGAVAHDNIIRLPRLNMPVFSGDPLSWEPFWDSFKAAVHSSPSLSAVQKLTYLRSQLQGSAAKVISGLTLTDASYDHSVALLKERFGQKPKLIQTHMQALLDLPAPIDTFSSLESFHDTIEGHVRSLTSLGKSADSYGDLLAQSIVNKLPNKTRKNLVRERGNSEWTFQELMAAIKQEVRLLELEVHSTQPTSYTRTTASLYAGATNKSDSRPTSEPSRKPCIFCKGPHPPVECTMVTDLDQRREVIKKQRLCFNCLGRHKVSECTSRNRCRKCQRKHHTCMCSSDGTPGNTQQKSGATPTLTATLPVLPSPQSSQSMMTQLQPLAVPPTQSTVPTSTALLATVPTDAMSLHSAELGTCLLKTAVGSIAANGLCVEANILFDEGSQRSFLTKGLADSLNLHPRATETIALSTFGSQSTRTVKVDVTTVYLIAISGERIPLSVLIVPTITAPLQRVATTSFTELPYLQGVHLAHPITTGDRPEITLLIGADQYWNVVEDHIIRGNGPTAMQSKLGYLLSGPTTSPVVNSDTATSILYVATAHSPDHALEKFWNVETLGTTQLDNKPTMTFMDQYLSTAITREPNGAYTACFLWKENHPPLPCNYSTCAR